MALLRQFILVAMGAGVLLVLLRLGEKGWLGGGIIAAAATATLVVVPYSRLLFGDLGAPVRTDVGWPKIVLAALLGAAAVRALRSFIARRRTRLAGDATERL